MTITILILGLSFIAVAFILKEENAKFLLSGYNTMKKQEREKFNIKAFIPFFKSFHIFLGISVMLLAFVIKFLVNDKASNFSLIAYPLLAYIYFFKKSDKFYLDKPPITNKILILVLSFITILIVIKMLINQA
jgi:heme/copper-type cytochrome/quinol oxidase subunit 2